MRNDYPFMTPGIVLRDRFVKVTPHEEGVRER